MFFLVQVILRLLQTRILLLRFWTFSYLMRYLFVHLLAVGNNFHLFCHFTATSSQYNFQVRDQDIVYGLCGISLECRETAWKWLKVWGLLLLLYMFQMNITSFDTLFSVIVIRQSTFTVVLLNIRIWRVKSV